MLSIVSTLQKIVSGEGLSRLPAVLPTMLAFGDGEYFYCCRFRSDARMTVGIHKDRGSSRAKAKITFPPFSNIYIYSIILNSEL